MRKRRKRCLCKTTGKITVADSDLDPCVYKPPGSVSGSVCHKYGSGSGSFNHQAKIVRKTLISSVLWLLLWLYFFEKWWKCTRVPDPDLYVFEPPGSASGSSVSPKILILIRIKMLRIRNTGKYLQKLTLTKLWRVRYFKATHKKAYVSWVNCSQ